MRARITELETTETFGNESIPKPEITLPLTDTLFVEMNSCR